MEDVLKNEDRISRAYKQAVRFLGYRPRSQKEVFDYLVKKRCPKRVASSVVEQLTRETYLDDRAFAQYWVENRERFKPRSPFALRIELKEKGVAEGIIKSVLTGLDEKASAWSAATAKIKQLRQCDRETFKRRLLGFLERRGFSYETAYEIFEQAWDQMESKGGDKLG